MREPGPGDIPSLRDVWEFLAPAGWATQWYWPEDVHGKVWNFFHGKGWKVG